MGSPVPLADRLERERRRAVRAEARLAEIELALRREIERSGDGTVSAHSMRSLLEAVQSRVASLEDEVRASEKELLELVAAQRRDLAALGADESDLTCGLEHARRELGEVARSEGERLPELARQRVDFEVELDRLQSMLMYRDNICDGLADELEQGTRAAAEVTSRLAELSWGRVAPARHPAAQDARVASLRQKLENEQAQLRQAHRALEVARAELKVAQRGVSNIEDEAGAKVSRLQQQVADLRSQRDRLAADLESATARAADDARRVQRALDEERAARVRLQEQARNLEARVADLDRQTSLSDDAREEGVRSELVEVQRELEETEAERIALAERVSLLQAALSVKESQLRLDAGDPSLPSKRNVVSLLPGRGHPGAAVVAPPSDAPAPTDAETDRLIRQREGEIEKLSQRWRALQGAYRDAVAEFDEVRARRDRLIRKLGPVAGPEDAGPADAGSADAGAPRAAEASVPVLALARDGPGAPTSSAARGAEDVESDDVLVVRERDPRPLVLVHLDDDERLDAGRSLAASVGAGFTTAREPQLPSRAEMIVATNLLARQFDPFQALATLAGDDHMVRSLMYSERGGQGRVWGPVDVFPPPFDPHGCAEVLHTAYPRMRRAMAVGESVDAMNRLREILGRWHCSTAVAFEPGQARELIPLVRPEYILIDLSIPECAGFELLAELSARSDPPVDLGVTWSSPIAAQDVASLLAAGGDSVRSDGATFDQRGLEDALRAMVAGGPARASAERSAGPSAGPFSNRG